MLRNERRQAGAEEDGAPVLRKAERAYSWLREEILAFRMQPGMFIDKIEICDKLGVSKQPVTAALTRLEQEGLVEIYAQRGSYVARLRLGAMTESLFVRGALESAIARRLAEEGAAALVETLKRNLADQDAAITADDAARYYALDRAFHSAIARALPFSQVANQIDLGLATVKRCHELFRPGAEPMRSSNAAHHRIAEAIAARDGEAAAREITLHVAAYTDMLKRFAETRPELFVG